MPKRRFLLPHARSGDGLGYDGQPQRDLNPGGDPPERVAQIADATAMCDEPECINSPAILDAYGESARYYETLRHAANVQAARQARRHLATEQRMVTAEMRARQQHHNLSGEFHVIRAMLNRARSGGRKEPPAALCRLEKIEATLDGMPDAA